MTFEEAIRYLSLHGCNDEEATEAAEIIISAVLSGLSQAPKSMEAFCDWIEEGQYQGHETAASIVVYIYEAASFAVITMIPSNISCRLRMSCYGNQKFILRSGSQGLAILSSPMSCETRRFARTLLTIWDGRQSIAI